MMIRPMTIRNRTRQESRSLATCRTSGGQKRSRHEKSGRRRTASPLFTLLLLCIVSLGSACAKRPPPVGDDVLLPLALPRNFAPEPADLAAARLAAAALANERAAVRRHMSEVVLEGARHESGKLVPLCQDMVNATLDDPAAYRAASRDLHRRAKGDPVLRARLEQAVADDILALARARAFERWERLWARTFNAVSEPLGNSIITGFTLAPFSLANSGVHYLASFSNDEPLSLTDRQALVLRKDYVSRHPDAEATPKLREEIADAEEKLEKTLRRRRLRGARAAIRSGLNRWAVLQAERSLRHGRDERAEDIRDEALARISANQRLRASSLASSRAPLPGAKDEAARAVATALLASSSFASPLSPETLDIISSYRDTDEAQYILATAQLERGYEIESWRRLARVAAREVDDSHMARHARALVGSPWQDPYRAFRASKRKQVGEMIKFRLLGPFAERRRYPNLSPLLGFLIDSPALAQTLITAPIRIIFESWKKGPDFQRPTALLAYRYLGLHPDGVHRSEVLGWLYRYEDKRGNSIAALRLADFTPGFDAKERAKLAEESAKQALSAADRERRFDRRNSILHQVVRDYPDTKSGKAAGRRARAEAIDGSAQLIRMTGSFLKENPRVAGADALGLNPVLMNGEIEDGELHPNGVTFLGGRHIRIALVGETGDEDDEAENVHRVLSEERLARLAAILDETARKNQLIDVDDTLGPDPDRDQFLERARLGLAGRPDRRAAARSTYVYRSMRERYGVVRGRESILPFDLVLQGNFTDLTLGAFPRWRMPKETPDAFLYR